MWDNLETFELMGCLAKESGWKLIMRFYGREVDSCGEFSG